MKIAWVTTFPDAAWELYAKACLHSLARFLPTNAALFVGLDNVALREPVQALLRPGDKFYCGWLAEHAAFVQANKSRDHATEYRLMATRFCHKIFVIKRVLDEVLAAGGFDYLVWWDGDALLTRTPTPDDLQKVLPRENEVVSYLGRKDWDHSECGFMGFNLKHKGAAEIITFMHHYYVSELVFSLPQWHDSYLFDVARAGQPCRNISEGVAGNNVWAHTALAAFSEHWKGERAKARNKALTDTELFGKAEGAQS